MLKFFYVFILGILLKCSVYTGITYKCLTAVSTFLLMINL